MNDHTVPAVLFLNEPVKTDLYKSLEKKYGMFNFRFAKKEKTPSEQQRDFLNYIEQNFYPSTEYKLEALYLGYSGFHPMGDGLTEELIIKYQQLQFLKVITLCSRGIDKVCVDYLQEKYNTVIKNYDDNESYVANDVADCAMYHVLEGFRKFSYQQGKLRDILHSEITRGYLRGDQENELKFCFGHELQLLTEQKNEIIINEQQNDLNQSLEYLEIKNETTEQPVDVIQYMYTNSPMNKKALIMGYGKIGQRVALKLKYGLSMDVSYTTRSGERDEVEDSLRDIKYYPWGNWNDDLSQFDAIVLCLPLSQQTKHLINDDFLKKCSRDQNDNLNHLTLVNLGRGMLIDWENIPEYLVKDRIRHIGLDVFYNEPALTKECDNLNEMNSSITPHIGSSTFEVFNRSSEFCLNLIKDTLG
ncbi:uncharacterized protein HGUI_01402 [Hanseniaspora guilliermondii]|uniref:D-isomer specific 2-hydroxyacid dehydrogenase NAD-binding domain-containing protein n=1 Tax=Hanseniaspora guilliermondii TaxID=56406 RepID=A0A1L0AYI8_9ASCO|nr:uncharacterized protein HGUI_01402 [Hanseniaspora guilliermondii]